MAQPGPGPRKCVSFREKILAARWFEKMNNILQFTVSALKPMHPSPSVCILHHILNEFDTQETKML